MSNVLVTGVTGFVGKSLVNELVAQNFAVSVLVRNDCCQLPDEVKRNNVGNFIALSDYSKILTNVEIVVHVAGRAHIMNDFATNPLEEFRRINTHVTLHLGRQAAEAGVKRFIFLSSIKVNGETTGLNESFVEKNLFIPDDPYGASKYEAEQGLLALAEETGMEVVIIRLPLVYGPYVKGNFSSLIKWVNRGVPLPFGAVHNKRSFIALDNLVGFIIHCFEHPKAANEVFLISDGEEVSTTELLRKVAKAFGKQSLLVPVPTGLMTSVAKLMGREDVTDKLLSSLQVDSSKARELLGWEPIVTMDEQLKKIAEAYLDDKTI